MAGVMWIDRNNTVIDRDVSSDARKKLKAYKLQLNEENG